MSTQVKGQGFDLLFSPPRCSNQPTYHQKKQESQTMPAMTLMMGGRTIVPKKLSSEKEGKNPSSRPNQPYNPFQHMEKKKNTRISPFRCLVPEEELKRKEKRERKRSRPKVAALWQCRLASNVQQASMGRRETSAMSLPSSRAESIGLPCRFKSIAPSEPSLALEPLSLLAPTGIGTRDRRMTS